MKNKDLTPGEYETDEKNTESGYEDYELKEACETLLKAEMIKKDEKMMAAITPVLKQKAEAAASLVKEDKVNPKAGIKGMRKFINEKISEA